MSTLYHSFNEIAVCAAKTEAHAPKSADFAWSRPDTQKMRANHLSQDTSKLRDLTRGL